MALETGTYIADLNSANPGGADPKSQGDDHIRLLKQVILDSFPGFTGAVLVGGTSTGVDGAYVLTPTNPLLGYTANTLIAWKPNVTNTGAATINISGLGVRNVLQSDGTMLRPGDMSQYVLMVDTGTEYRLIGLTKNYVDQLVFTAALPGQPGTATQYELISVNNVASWSLRSQMRRSLRTLNTQITVLDQGQIIDFTAGSFTQTFALPSLLTDGFWVILKNSSNADVELEAPAAITTTSGSIASPGTATSFNVPAGLAIVAGDLVIVRRTSLPYVQRIIATASAYTANTAQTISTITNVGTTATLTTAAPHGLLSGNTVTISGATPNEYNGTFVIVATSSTTFTYTMLSAPASTALPVGSYVPGSTLALTVGYRVDESGVSPATISSITSGGTLATLTTATAHGLATGNYVVITGTTPAAYNGQFKIVVTSATTFTYTMGSAPGGVATIIGVYAILFDDWTITTRAATAGVDTKASYLMYPGEERLMQCNGTALNSYVQNGFTRDWLTTGPVIKPPGYKSFSGLLSAGGASGMKSGSTAIVGFASGGGATLPFSFPAASIPESGSVVIGAGGIGPSATAAGTQGGNSTYSGITSYGGGPGATAGGGSGGGLISAGVLGTSTGRYGSGGSIGGRPRETASGADDDANFGGGNGTTRAGPAGSSVYGGAGGGGAAGASSIYGGAAGGASNTSVGSAGGTSTFGGNGGAGGNAGVSGVDGSVPGGAGGATQTGAKAGNGGNGRLRMKGEL